MSFALVGPHSPLNSSSLRLGVYLFMELTSDFWKLTYYSSGCHMLRNEYKLPGLAPGSTLKCCSGAGCFFLWQPRHLKLHMVWGTVRLRWAILRTLGSTMFPETGGSQDFSQRLTCLFMDVTTQPPALTAASFFLFLTEVQWMNNSIFISGIQHFFSCDENFWNLLLATFKYGI